MEPKAPMHSRSDISQHLSSSLVGESGGGMSIFFLESSIQRPLECCSSPNVPGPFCLGWASWAPEMCLGSAAPSLAVRATTSEQHSGPFLVTAHISLIFSAT